MNIRSRRRDRDRVFAHHTGAVRKDAPYTPPPKYTIRLQGLDAAALERRAEGREMPPSSHAAQVLRAHLRTSTPVPYQEFQQIKRIVNELGGIRASLFQLAASAAQRSRFDAELCDAIRKLLPLLKSVREDVQNTLSANSKSWEAPDA